MQENLIFEKEILIEKRKKIQEEISKKKENISAVETKFKVLSKESKGNYSEEKETTEKVLNLLSQNIKSYEEANKEPYFGKVDFRERLGDVESIYIGKQSITSTEDGEEIVVDWRTPVADLYYSGTGGSAFYKSPSGVIEGELSLKRKFLFKDENLDRIFDEGINEIILRSGGDLVDEFLKINLEESRGKKLKEVVSTIQKEQNDIIRWPKNLPLIVQGSAGSGKTTIALHRLAYLVYRYSETIKGKDILVLAPNKIFLDYISEILPNLGVDEVNQTTFNQKVVKDLKLKTKIFSKDEKLKYLIENKDKDRDKLELLERSSRFKGSIKFKEMIDRYMSLLDGDSIEIIDIEIEGHVLFYKKEIMRLYLKDLKNYPINKRKDEINRYLNLKLKERIEVICNHIEKEWDLLIKKIKLENSENKDIRSLLIKAYEERDIKINKIRKNSKAAMKEYFSKWRGITSKDIYVNLFKEDILFDISSLGEIEEDLKVYMKEEVINNFNNKITDEDDLAALLYINFLLEGIEEKNKFMHIVVDEAQDYSEFQILLISKLAKGNSLTLVGDLAQGIYYYRGIENWNSLIENIFDKKSTFMELSQSYRSTIEIINFSEPVLKSQNLNIKISKPVLRHGDEPKIIKVKDKKEITEKIDEIIKFVKDKEKNSIAIITKDEKEAKEVEKILKKSKYNVGMVKDKEEIEKDAVIIPSYLTKGLEFDATILFDPNFKKYEENSLDKRLLYVSLTRALHYEFIIEFEKLTKFIYNNKI